MGSNDRIDDFERRLRALELELAELRRLSALEEEPVAEMTPVPEYPPAPVVLPEPDGAWEEAQPAERWYERSYDLNDIRFADLLGARALAWAGGIVFLLGIVLFFALAVNRGWIGAEARVALGAIASALVFGSGLWLRRRFGETYAALAAVGAGIAGGYATLLAAGPHYGLIPDWAALAVAAAIAAGATAIALWWSSEIVAGIGLVGALAVQVPISWGDGVTTTGTGFVAAMFAAAAVVAVIERWELLLSASVIVVVPQVIALAVEHRGEGAGWPLVAATACTAVLLAAGIALHLRSGESLEPFHATLILGAAVVEGVAQALLFHHDRTGGGVALLAVAAVYGALALPFALRARRDLALLLFAVALAATAVGLADLLSGASLGVAWGAEAAVLAWLAFRIGDLRVQLGALAYLVLATVHVVAIDTPPTHLFREYTDHTAGIAALLATVAGYAVAAWYARPDWPERPAHGFWELFDDVVAFQREHEPELRFGLAWLAGLGAVYAAALGILELPGSFAWHQVGITALFLGVPLGLVVAGLVLRQRPLVLAGAAGLVLGIAENVIFDLTQLEPPPRAWTMVIAGSALLVAGFLYHRLEDVQDLHPLAGVAVVGSAAYAVGAPFDLLDGRWTGAALLVPAAVYAGLSALVAGIPRLRDLATLLWIEALGIAILAAWLLLEGTALVAAWCALAGVLIIFSWRTGEWRYQAGAALCIVLSGLHALILDAPPTHFFSSSAHPAQGAGAVAITAVTTLALALVADVPDELGGSRTPIFAVAGVLGLYAASLAVLELFQLLSGRVETDFERGHAAVSALWGILALVLLYLGLTRRLSLRIAGFVLFGLVLAKIFLYDLATLSPVARALSFLAVGGVLLLGGFFYQRLSAGRREPGEG